MFTPKHYFIINLLSYQICWFGCVLGAANGLPWVGPIVAVIAVVYHLIVAIKPSVELILIVCVTLIGGLWDSLLVTMGWLKYPNGLFIEGMAPYWIFSLWVTFAITLNVSLAWFKQHLVLSSLFGAIGGPLAFLAGEKLDAVQFPDTNAALASLAIGWTLLMPLMILLARRFNGFAEAAGGR